MILIKIILLIFIIYFFIIIFNVANIIIVNYFINNACYIHRILKEDRFISQKKN